MKRILVFIDWYLPAYKAGGQIKSLANQIDLLGDDFEFSIVTSDRDLNQTSTLEGISIGNWQKVGKANVIYLNPELQTYSSFKNIIQQLDFDIVYFQSFFSFRFTILPLYIIKTVRKHTKIILAPRGMLADNALKIKHFKKSIFIWLAKFWGLYKKISWHASTSLEKAEIEKLFGKNVPIKIASDIAILPNRTEIIKNKQKGELHLFFLSRICEKKNLYFALQMLEELRLPGIKLDIIGPDDDMAYANKCKALAEKLKDFNEINFLGSIHPSDIHKQLLNYHFMFFPTFNENFGHVIAEALAAGCPLIISNNTPWRNLEQNNCGWDIDLNEPEKYKLALKLALNMNNEMFQKMLISCKQFLEKQLPSEIILNDNRQIFD